MSDIPDDLYYTKEHEDTTTVAVPHLITQFAAKRRKFLLGTGSNYRRGQQLAA